MRIEMNAAATLMSTNFRRTLLAGMAVIALASCGGGGGGGGGSASAINFGWINISQSDYTTESDTASLSGEAFLADEDREWRGDGVLSIFNYRTPVSITWRNETTGHSGSPSSSKLLTEWCLFDSSRRCIENHTWKAEIPLVAGRNVITVTAKDSRGNAGSRTVTVTYHDVNPPTVLSTSPIAGATGVGTGSAFSVIFSEAMDPASISNSTIGLKDSLTNPVSGSVTYANSVATFTPVSSLQSLTTYVATVTTGVRDIAGNALAADHAWVFTTAIAPDVTPPTLSSTSPTNGARCVPTEADLTATFSEPVSPASVSSSTFVLRDPLNNSVNGSVGYGVVQLGVYGAAFGPAGPLTNSSSYTATITTGLTDLSGNHLVSDYTWTFTTDTAGTGAWNATSTIGSPSSRTGHTAVWTGTEMIVWGGSPSWLLQDKLGDGARYDPAKDGWTPMSSVGAPEPRSGHVAVWTGSKMIVWGGMRSDASLNSGAIYDPATDSWRSMSSMGAPSARGDSSGVWTGTEMIVWGGAGDGARYNPVTNSWSAVSASGAPTAGYGRAIWTGSTVLIWGGSSGAALEASGGIYTPLSDTWTAIPTTGAPSARGSPSVIWTGTEMIVWGGWDGTNPLSTGARFNPTSNSWQSMSSACTPLGRYGHVAFWSGTEMIVWGGGRGNGPLYRVGGRYNPNTDTWQPTPAMDAPSTRLDPRAVWTGTDMIVWGGIDVFTTTLNSGGRYRPQ